MAKSQIPDALKSDLPQNKWGKVLATTPVVMTVIATLLAGLSSSEMIRAQYDRSLAAQQQSKAGDQWGYFQAKRLRAAQQRSALDVIRATATVYPLDPKRFDPASADPATLDSLAHGTLPATGPEPMLAEPIAAALAAVETGQSDEAVAQLLKAVKKTDLANALATAAHRVREFDAVLKPVTSGIDALEKHISPLIAPSFVAARLAFSAERYEAESRQNQVIAQLLELQVRQSNVSAERHHSRSGFFFYGMLAAQLAVIISTLSLAVQRRNGLWLLAAVAGVLALIFAVYVYLFV
jgi:hypothetical protein